MAKKRRRRGLRLGIGKYVNLIFKIIGVTVAASPAIDAAVTFSSDPAKIPRQIVYNYFGVDPGNPSTPNTNRLIGGLAAVFGGLAIAKLGGIVSRMVR